MTPSEDLTFLDPEKVRFDLSLPEAFALTSVRSLEDYHSLKESLPHLRGQSYFFINISGSQPRLILTIITSEKQEITATYEIDPHSLGIDPLDLTSAVEGCGNHPLPRHLGEIIRIAIENDSCLLRMVEKH
ncbi:MAG: hypothetical protein KBA97_08540 [Methanothrix sp.]|nr:hypothetical protein [Methanothrix sp.]